ncbi:DegT/DnrJ/EryC1/StrS family aminotransferase [Paenibacillus polymyxa]|uniref:DegT/DnrJ/EryC1/StrS family aminotransferase n=1 Tax=Paenibacillus polymyxa TaxID=1406 RepID=UPI0004DEFD8D|nr:aminotransferase class I/II-fold pyridoxal phosphate-dependent enzyme [Paenibacillus polymyxa]
MNLKNSFPWFSEEDKVAFLKNSKKILDSGVLISGEYTFALEKATRELTSAKYAVGLSSGTAALEIILKYLECEDSEVLVPNNTFISTLYAIQNAKGKPILVDIDPYNFCIEIQDFISKINKKTKAVIIVHLAGYITEHISEIKKICTERNIFLIEDSSHAFGAKYEDFIAGNIGFASACSFYPTKIVTGGTGGILTTNNEGLNNFAIRSRSHGSDETGANHFLSPNWYISEFNALLCYLQIKSLDMIIEKRNQIATLYSDFILSRYSNYFRIQPIHNKRVHTYYKYIVKTDLNIKESIIQYFRDRGIALGHCYGIQLNQHPSVKHVFSETLSSSLDYADKHFTLPCHLNISELEAQQVINILESYLNVSV